MKISKVNGKMVFECEGSNDESIILNALEMYTVKAWENAEKDERRKGHWLYAEGIKELSTNVYLKKDDNVPPQIAESIA